MGLVGLGPHQFGGGWDHHEYVCVCVCEGGGGGGGGIHYSCSIYRNLYLGLPDAHEKPANDFVMLTIIMVIEPHNYFRKKIKLPYPLDKTPRLLKVSAR